MFFFFFFFFFYETFLLLFLTKFLYEIANVSFYFIMYTDILHIIRILSISPQFCLRELLRSLFFFLLSTFIVVIYFLMLIVTITIILLLM